jgi:hypothetical protein
VVGCGSRVGLEAIHKGEPTTKIVVIGRNGLIGMKLVPLLRQQGHEAVSASPSSGVNALTGEGLPGALVGANVVVDVSNSYTERKLRRAAAGR